jgi:hypothetical protein
MTQAEQHKAKTVDHIHRNYSPFEPGPRREVIERAYDRCLDIVGGLLLNMPPAAAARRVVGALLGTLVDNYVAAQEKKAAEDAIGKLVPLKKGDRVRVYEDVIKETIVEGEATIVSEPKPAQDGFVTCNVKFPDDAGAYYRHVHQRNRL